MTLVLTAINAACVVQTSDRLTTKYSRQQFLGEHDPLANKTVICLTMNPKGQLNKLPPERRWSWR